MSTIKELCRSTTSLLFQTVHCEKLLNGIYHYVIKATARLTSLRASQWFVTAGWISYHLRWSFLGKGWLHHPNLSPMVNHH